MKQSLLTLTVYEKIQFDLPGEYQDVVTACNSAGIAIPPELYRYIQERYRISSDEVDWVTMTGWRRLPESRECYLRAGDGSLRLKVATGDGSKVVKVVME